MLKRIIPSSGEELAVIGLGTWQTFDVANAATNEPLKSVVRELYTAGGRLIDSSPMYGKAEQAVGDITSMMDFADDLFYATKVWTRGLHEGIRQMEASMQKIKRPVTDLMQIHNLMDWKTYLPLLQRWKEEGRIRYTGITHYTDASHEELERIIRKEKIDFVQFNYSIQSRHAEKRLLPACADLGIATLINRPLGEGHVFNLVKGKSLPAWAAELNINNWAAYFLKYIIAHPAVTCVIPATGNPLHAADNLSAGDGSLPDAIMRKKMAAHLTALQQG